MKILCGIYLCLIISVQAYAINALEFDINSVPPTSIEYVELRSAAGMKPRTVASAEKGLSHSLYWITVRHAGKLVGMGRVIGDGGTIAQVTDIAVHPDFQGRGLGSLIFESIQQYILANIPEDAFVCLFAEMKAVPFYEEKGFVLSQEKWPGMYWPCLDRAGK